MRAREFLQEDYSQSLDSDLNNLLVGAKGSGSEAINTSDLVSQLNAMGYSVNNNSIVSLLNQNPNVTSATPTVVNLQKPEVEQNPGADKDSASHVSSLAQKANTL